MSLGIRLAGFLALVLAFPIAAAAQPAVSSSSKAADKAADSTDQPTLGDDRAAIDAGKQWLSLIDAGRSGEAWDVTAKQLRASVARSDWISGMSELRKPYGKLVSRAPARFARTHQLPNAPDGDYAIVEYATVFDGGKNAVEQLTWMLEADGNFRISGYFIR